MQYLLLIYDSEADWGKLTAADQAAMYQEYGQFRKEITEKEKFRAGSQLQPIATATTVRVRNGKRYPAGHRAERRGKEKNHLERNQIIQPARL
jgi:hypothetical protein